MQSVFNSLWFRAVSFVAAGVLIVLGLASFREGLNYVGKPYPGFVIYTNRIVGIVHPFSFYSESHSVFYMDVIEKVNGRGVSTGAEIMEIVANSGPGTPFKYTVDRFGKSIDILVPSRTFTQNDLISSGGVITGAGFILLVFSLILLMLKSHSRSSMLFLGLAFSAGSWSILGFDFNFTYHYLRLFLLFVIPFTTLIFWFSFFFPEERAFVKRWPWILYTVLVPSLAIGIFYQAFLWHPAYYRYVDLSAWLCGMLGFTSVAASIFSSFFGSSAPEARVKVSVIMWSYGLPILAGIALTVPAVFFTAETPVHLVVAYTVGWLCLIGLIVYRYNIFDVETAIRRTMAYGIITLLIFGTCVVMLSVVGYLFGGYEVFKFPMFPILFAVFILLLFIPFRDGVRLFVDKAFFKEAYEAQKIIEDVSEALITTLDLDALLAKLDQAVARALNPAHFRVLLAEADGLRPAVHGGKGAEDARPGPLEASGTLLAEFSKNPRKTVSAADLQTATELKDALGRMGAELAVPLVMKGKITGVLILGKKARGSGYSTVDMRLLRTLADQAVMGIENARLLKQEKERERMSMELETARKVQFSLLPQGVPSFPGLEIAGRIINAKEVGGDYYDFITVSEKELGIVIGDVAGKGVPAALTMAMIKGAFQSHLESVSRPREMLVRLNVIASSFGKRQIVTLFYCVFDSTQKELKFANAGHSFPLLLRAGKAEFVGQSTGLPLGANPNVLYQESRMNLLPGDMLLLYTDGIVEAQNGRREMFGFDRLEELINSSPGLAPGALIEKIVESVKAFTGSAGFDDDVTIVAIKVT